MTDNLIDVVVEDYYDTVVTMLLAIELNPHRKQAAARNSLELIRKRLKTKSMKYVTKKAMRDPYAWAKREEAILGDALYNPEIIDYLRKNINKSLQV